MKSDAIELGEIVFVAKRGHVGLAATINQVNLFCSEPFCGGNDVNGGVPCSDARYAAANRDVLKSAGLGGFDEFHRADDAVEFIARDFQIPSLTEADADKNCVEVFFQFFE